MGFADNIQESFKNKAVAPTTAAGGNTAGILKQLSSQASGKTAIPSGGGVSNVMESVAGVQAIQQQDAVAEQVSDAAQDISLQEQSYENEDERKQDEFKIASMKLDMASSEQIATTLDTIEKFDGDLSDSKQEHELEMLSSKLALQDKQYVHTITQIGEKNRLHDKGEFRMETTRLAIGNKTAEYFRDKDSRESEAAKERKFNDDNSRRDLDNALKFAKAKIEDSMKAQKVGFATDMAKEYVGWGASEDGGNWFGEDAGGGGSGFDSGTGIPYSNDSNKATPVDNSQWDY